MQKKSISLILSLCFIFCFFTACKNDTATQPDESSTNASSSESSTSQNIAEPLTTSAAQQGDDNTDLKIDTYITLNDSNTVIKGNGATFSDNIITISQEGTYSLSGTLSNGKIYINSSTEDKKVKLFFNGVSINCDTDAPLFIENSPDETVIILADGSINNLSDTARTVPEDENADYATAVIYSKDDLQIEGSGTLNITANFNKGIFSKNDIDIRGGIINITSVDDGIRGKESVDISDGTITIQCGGDGIRTNETAEEGKGNINISGGNINISSELDCIQSVVDITISGGSFNLVSAGGSTGVSSSQDNGTGMQKPGGMGGGRGGFGMYGGQMPNNSSAMESTTQDTPSTKGIKADNRITINAGSFTISSADDAIHALNVDIYGGSFDLKSDDDGLHADGTVNIQNADINISYSYEGVEGTIINILSGTVKVVSSDDGFNAAGDTTSSGMGGMQNPMAADYSCVINVSDGYVFINAGGDGVDSNGNVNQSGGTILVFGPENGANGALDYGGTYTLTGGTLLATGSSGMAQSVTGDGIEVLAFTYSCSSNVLNTIADSNGNSLIGFLSPKQFGTVVYASDKLEKGGTYSVYTDGSYTSQAQDGIYLDGEYTPGELVGSLTLS